MYEKMTEVVAAFITRGGMFLICKRPESKARGGLWEFVGGKVEPGETEEQALVRECGEELGIGVTVGEKLLSVVHEYPDITVKVTFFRCSMTGAPCLFEHTAAEWITPDEIDGYEFCPADADFLRYIKENVKAI